MLEQSGKGELSGVEASELDLEDDLSEEEVQRSQIARRLALGVVMIVILLAVLFISEYLSQDEPAVAVPPPEPKAEAPVPQTIGQSVTGPVTPVAPPEPEAPKPAEPAPPPKAEEPPPPPVVSAVPESKPAPRLAPRPHVSPAPRTPPAAAPAPAPVVPKTPVARVEPAPVKPAPLALPRLLNGYSLQAGMFASPEKAQELHALLTLNGIPSTLETRVRVGPFKNKAEADAARAKLKELGVESLMLPPRK